MVVGDNVHLEDGTNNSYYGSSEISRLNYITSLFQKSRLRETNRFIHPVTGLNDMEIQFGAMDVDPLPS
jgi:hypothetical protein